MGFTSLKGGPADKALDRVGDAILASDDVFDPAAKTLIGNFWNSTALVIKYAGHCPANDSDRLASMCRNWGLEFKSLGDAGLRGFGQENFTPYSHVLSAHVPFLVKLRGGLEKFSGESLEKKNDDVKKTFMRITNNYDLIGAMRTEKRREISLRNQEVFFQRNRGSKTDRPTKREKERERERERKRKRQRDRGGREREGEERHRERESGKSEP